MGGKTLFCGGAKKKDKFFNKTCSSGVPWWSSDWLHAPNAGVPSSIPGQGARFHKLQLTVCMLQLKRILHITTKSWHNQINKYLLKQNKSFFFLNASQHYWSQQRWKKWWSEFWIYAVSFFFWKCVAPIWASLLHTDLSVKSSKVQNSSKVELWSLTEANGNWGAVLNRRGTSKEIGLKLAYWEGDYVRLFISDHCFKTKGEKIQPI